MIPILNFRFFVAMFFLASLGACGSSIQTPIDVESGSVDDSGIGDSGTITQDAGGPPCPPDNDVCCLVLEDGSTRCTVNRTYQNDR